MAGLLLGGGSLPAADTSQLILNADFELWNNNDLPFGARDKFDRVRFMDPFSSHFILKRDASAPIPYFFYPPRPPPLEADIPLLEPLDPGPAAPADLAAFAGEIFYPMLGASLAYGDLPKDARARLVSYRDRQQALLTRLRAGIRELKDLGPSDRAAGLAKLAQAEAAELGALEAEAESFRAALRPTNLLGEDLDSPGMERRPRWVPHAVAALPTDPADRRRESAALQYAAFYQPGLGTAQRRLLQEAALEVWDQGRPEDPAPPAGLLAFSPATSAIRLPGPLPGGVQAQVDAYVTAKAALKAELRNALAEPGISDRQLAQNLQRLTAAQVGPLENLEARAEAIRRGLAALPNPAGPPAAPPLPPELTARISAYRMHKLEVLRKLRAMLAAPTASPSRSSDGSLATGPLTWMHDGSTATEVPAGSLRVTVAEFDRAQSELIAALDREELSIRQALAAYVRSGNGHADRKSLNDLLRDFENARQQQELWDRYSDYHTAVLLPGLAPAQRQVLFEAGIEHLGLPLPVGEKPPVAREDSRP